MTTEEAWEIYNENRGKNGRPKKIAIEAEALLIKTGELNPNLPQEGTKSEKEEKKPQLIFQWIKEPHAVPRQRRIDIYLEAREYIMDKRNFSFDFYLAGSYGLTRKDLEEWEKDQELLLLRRIASETVEHKMVDSLCDKWGGGNPLGLMMMLKAIYGYNDRGDSGALKADGVISVTTNLADGDYSGIDYGDEDGAEE